MIKLIPLLTLLLSVLNLSADIRATQWEVVDIEFELGKTLESPLDLTLGAIIVHEDGETLNVPGFYNGDATWVIRFCPPEEGEWTYTTYSSEPLLSGQSDRIRVSRNRNPEVRGPVGIDPTHPQKFSYADGTPYFTLAFELDWLFALDAENAEDIPRTREIISHVKANNFNQIVMNVYAYSAGWGEKDKIAPEHNFAEPRVFPFGGTNENPDYSVLNVEFFQRFDRVIEHLNEMGIIAHAMIYVWNKRVNWPEPESEADNHYFDYIVKRYQAYPNLIWDISKEALDYGRDDIGYITRRIERLRKLDGHDRLVTVHDYLYCSTHPEMVDFISTQNWKPNLYDEMARTLERHKDKPVFNIEHGGYERSLYSIFDGAYNDPIVCLERNYLCAFAGAYSTYYWQHTSWYNVITDPFSLPEDKQPVFELYKHFVEFFESHPYNEFDPIPYGNTYVLSNGEDLLCLLPDKTIKYTGHTPPVKGNRYRMRWFDPLTGQYHAGGERSFNGIWASIERPEGLKEGMAILVLDYLGAAQ